MTRIKVRQHVNPLARRYQEPFVAPDFGNIYRDCQLHWHLDIGCARGRFPLQMAAMYPDWNFLGVEIREALVIEANRIRDENQLGNLHYIFANINIAAASLLAALPAGKLRRVSIQFPDPCFKNKHVKRRMVRSDLVATIADFLPAGGEVFLQSDLEWVAADMATAFAGNSAFDRLSPTWLPENPLGIATEREIATQQKGEPVFRAIFRKST
jgi:tRNA (guanine-N7-)-methyltransferase